MEWHPINLEARENHELAMELPRSDTYQVNSVDVVICYTAIDIMGRIARKYCFGYFDHDGDTWYIALYRRIRDTDVIHEYLAWSYLDEYVTPT